MAKFTLTDVLDHLTDAELDHFADASVRALVPAFERIHETKLEPHELEAAIEDACIGVRDIVRQMRSANMLH